MSRKHCGVSKPSGALPVSSASVISCMRVQLFQNIPSADGYYLVQFGETQALHLVLLQTDEHGERAIISTDSHKKLFFKEFPTDIYWSLRIECKLVHGRSNT